MQPLGVRPRLGDRGRDRGLVLVALDVGEEEVRAEYSRPPGTSLGSTSTRCVGWR